MMTQPGRIGVFGGTFDPPHLGHLILAAEASYQLSLDRVLWVLTLQPPHKLGQAITPLAHRLEMVLAAIATEPKFSLSRVDIDRPAPHYAVDTVQILQQEYPQSKLIYLMGGDSLHNLPLWHQAAHFVAGCHQIGVMQRPGDHLDLKGLESQIPGITPKIRFVEAPLIDIAASQIRLKIQAGQPFRYFLSEAVYKIIQQRDLYR